jgi:predicted nuclease of predicted toxin-antitoxin system
MKWIVDTHLSPSFANFLNSLGEDAIHTTHFKDGHLLADRSIRKIAIETDRIIVSKDWDFFDDFFILGSPPKIVHLQIGNCSNKELFEIWQKNNFAIKNLFKEGICLIIISTREIIGY